VQVSITPDGSADKTGMVTVVSDPPTTDGFNMQQALQWALLQEQQRSGCSS
jgi:hypothetical protein